MQLSGRECTQADIKAAFMKLNLCLPPDTADQMPNPFDGIVNQVSDWTASLCISH